MRDYFPSILSLAEVLLRSPEPAITFFAAAMYKNGFVAFDTYCQQVTDLDWDSVHIHVHVHSYIDTSDNIIIDFLFQINYFVYIEIIEYLIDTCTCLL